MTGDPAEPAWGDLKGFSLVAGGPLYALARRAGLPAGPRGLLRLGLALAALTWLALFVLSAVQHLVLGGSTVSFLESLGTHARFLLAIPLFFVAEAWFDERARDVVDEMLESNLVKPGEVPRFARALQTVVRWRDAWVVEAVLVVLTIGLIVSGVRTDLPVDVTTGSLASAYTRAFDRKWLRGGAGPEETILGAADLQSLADLANSFKVIEEMRPVPFSLRHVLLLAVAAALPMVSLLFIMYPLDELVLRSVKSLVHL